MKRSVIWAPMPLLSLVLLIAASSLTATGKAAPVAGTASSAPAMSRPQAPLDWSAPVNISNNAYYDNNSSLGASPLSGAVTIGWEQRNDPAATANYIYQGSNSTLAGPITLDRVRSTSYKASGNVKVTHDSTGRRHMIWYEQSGSTVCDYYATIEPNGSTSTVEQVPGTCGGQMKGTAIAIGPDNSVHALFGLDNQAIFYYKRTSDGVWTVRGERVTDTGAPTGLTLGVTSNGTVMAGWMGTAPTIYYDIYTGVRTSPGQWAIENVSYTCCTGCPSEARSYLPSLAGDPSGGMRLTWADEQCDPRLTPRATDLYYREWVPGTGWNNKPLVRVVRDQGEVYDTAITVDSSGNAHIAFDDDTGRAFHDYQVKYVVGSGTTFTAPTTPFEAWSRGVYNKVPSLDFSPGYIHVSFNSAYGDPRKEVYYSYLNVAGGVPPTPPPVATATPVPQRCPGQRFTDVCPGDTFYTYIMNLVNLGVISGYSDNTFRPNNNLTRGQASKIVALAANLPANLQGAPHFTDVDQNNGFYEYVEFSYNAGVIAGYPCGGPGEPCDSQGRAYFRPNNNVTRGQLSKMTSQAFGFNESVTGQTFTDVPPTSTFYVFIERMARRGIIGGYSDGTFRPNTEVTRGQASKIVDGARLQPTATAFPTNTPTITMTSTNTSTRTITSTSTATEILPTVTVTEILPSVTLTLARP